MRPCGGFSPDMMNFANSTDVYKIWADMIAYDSTLMPQGEHAFCAFAGRRDGKHFRLSHEQLMTKYPTIFADEDGRPCAGCFVGRNGQHDVRRELPDGGRDERVLRGCVRDGVIPKKISRLPLKASEAAFSLLFRFPFPLNVANSAHCALFRQKVSFH